VRIVYRIKRCVSDARSRNVWGAWAHRELRQLRPLVRDLPRVRHPLPGPATNPAHRPTNQPNTRFASVTDARAGNHRSRQLGAPRAHASAPHKNRFAMGNAQGAQQGGRARTGGLIQGNFGSVRGAMASCKPAEHLRVRPHCRFAPLSNHFRIQPLYTRSSSRTGGAYSGMTTRPTPRSTAPSVALAGSAPLSLKRPTWARATRHLPPS
jgi:hypothetical protein